MKKIVLLALAVILLIGACKNDDDDATTPMVNDEIEGPYNPVPYTLEAPSWFGDPNQYVPEDNPMTVDGIALGRMLFYDPILSSDSTMSCSTCHQSAKGFADGEATSLGVLGIAGNRSSMPLINLVYNTKGFFWDGRSGTLEEQALAPVEDHRELNENWENVVEKLRNHPDYPQLFRKAFGIDKRSKMNKELAVMAIAQFERTMISANSRFDRVVWLNEGWATDSEQRGRELFFVEFAEPGITHPGCSHCHGSYLYTENNFFNNGIEDAEIFEDFPDAGLGGVTNVLYDTGKFRAPTLRNIALTAPYMHDGRFQTLEEVLDHYASGGHGFLNEDANIQQFNLSEQDKMDMINFLNMLTDTSFVNNPAFQNPFN